MTLAAREITADEEGLRLDRWFRRHYPGLSHARLEKLLRTGQVRVDGRRVKSGYRLAPGEQIRVPPEAAQATVTFQPKRRGPPQRLSAQERREIQELVRHKDSSMLVIDKPAGLAVQGGSAITRHLDGMLDALRFDGKERPKLVHRLDKDTSGVLALARTARAAASLTKAFRENAVTKTYWAVVVGVPDRHTGRIDLALGRRAGPGGERVRVDDQGGHRAITDYAVIDKAGREAAWLALRPTTGRTHQLRAHLAAIGTPILGDGKYGRRQAFLKNMALSKGLHLHAYELSLPRPEGGVLTIAAPPPPAFANSLAALGFSPADYVTPFEE